MSSGFIKRGALFERNGRKFLIVRDLAEGNLLVEDQLTGKATAESVVDLIRGWSNGHIILRGAPGQELQSVAELNPRERLERMSEQDQGVAWRKLKIIEAVAGLPQTPKRIQRHLSGLWATLNIDGPQPDGKTVCRWRRQLRLANGDIQALAPAHCRKGRRPVALHGDAQDAIREAMNQVWLKRERGSRKRVWEIAYGLVTAKNRLRLPEHQIPVPSLHQVRKEIRSLSAYEDFVARHGHDAARNYFRAVLQERTVTRALEEVQYDHTLFDVMVLDDRTGQLRGRPWITACVDRLTRSVVGFWIGFSPPSYSTLAKCHRHAILPKLGLKAEYPDLVNEWEAFGVPERALVDNGLEFHGHNFERICRRLGTVTVMSPRRAPWSKGIVERIFRTFNDDIAHVTPGTTFSNVIERGDYNSEQRAVVRFSVLRKLVIKYIVDVYHQRKHGALDTSPAEMWRMHPPEIRLPCSVDDVKHLFDKIEDRVLSERGVRVKDLYYNSIALAQMVKEVGKGATVEVGYDPDDLQRVRVTHLATGWTIEVPALRQDYAEGLDEWQHNMIKQWAKDRRMDVSNMDQLLEAKRQLDDYVRDEIARKGKRSSKRLHRMLRDSAPSSEIQPAEPHTGHPSGADGLGDEQDARGRGDHFEPSQLAEDYPDLDRVLPTPGDEAQ